MKKTELNEQFWTSKYLEQDTGWDMGGVSDPLKVYADQLKNKELDILIPGAGNAYEAEYLYRRGFQRVHVLDIAVPPLENLKQRFPDFPAEQMIHDNFFSHRHEYDLIMEQTFFCALLPDQRNDYAKKAHELLKPGGKLVGLLFDFPLDESGPPFGGSIDAYLETFSPYFEIRVLEPCYNSIKPRAGRELFINFEKKF